MIPEAAFAMLACARIGAIHSVVFGGFSIESLKDRVRTKDEEILKFMKNERCYKQTIESLEKQLKEKDEEIGQKTMELRQHSWRSNKMIYELQDKLDELQDELDETVKEREELRKEWKLTKGYT